MVTDNLCTINVVDDTCKLMARSIFAMHEDVVALLARKVFTYDAHCSKSKPGYLVRSVPRKSAYIFAAADLEVQIGGGK